VEEQRKEEVQAIYKKKMEELVDMVGERSITMEEFKRREKEMEKEKVRELGEEEERKGKEEVVEKMREKVMVEVLEMGGKRGQGRPKRKVSEGAETDVEGINIGMVYIVDREKMVHIKFYFFVFIIFNFCDCFIVHAVSRDQISAGMSSSARCYEVLEVHQGMARVSLGEREAGEHGREGGKKEGCDRH
jgi:hypothetical protein